MKKAILSLLVILLSFSSCSLPQSQEAAEGKSLSIVTSFYPLWYLATEIVGEQAEVINLAGSRDIHEYEPSPQDRVKLGRADLFLYQGAGLEPWVEDLLEELQSSGVTVLEVSAGLDLAKSDEPTDDDHGEFDPHTWLDPVLTQEGIHSIALALQEIDPEHSADYAVRAAALNGRFVELNTAYQGALGKCEREEALISHDAFGYLARRYDFTLHAIVGLSMTDEPSAKLLVDLAEEAEEGVTHILTEQSSVTRFADTLATETRLQMLPINPLGRGPLDDNKDYFEVMRDNLFALTLALGCTP